MHRPAGRHPTRRHPGPPQRLFRGGRRRGRDQHLRRVRSSLGRVRPGPPLPRDRQGQCRVGPRGGRQLLHPRPSPIRGRFPRTGYQSPQPRPDRVRDPEGSLPGGGRSPARGRRRPVHPGDPLRSASPQGIGHRGPPSHGQGRSSGTDPSPGHHGVDRPDAGRNRDRRRPVRHRSASGGRDRAQLCHRSSRDGRARTPPVPPRPNADLGVAQRRTALGGRRQDALRPHRRGVARPSAPLRRGTRRADHRWVLRHHPRIHQAPGRDGPRAHPRSSQPGSRAVGHVHLLPSGPPPGHVVPDDRRAHQRQRLQEVP